MSGRPHALTGKQWLWQRQNQTGLYLKLLSCVFAITPVTIQGPGERTSEPQEAPRQDSPRFFFFCQLSFSRVADGPDSFWGSPQSSMA